MTEVIKNHNYNESNDIINRIPPDTISLKDDYLNGKSFFLKKQDEHLAIYGKSFKIPKTELKDRILPDFYYKKPIVNPNGNAFNKKDISIIQEDKLRKDYVFLEIIEDVKRSPNHLHEFDNGILCAVLNKEWETRYFPKNSVDKDFWKEAVQMSTSLKKEE